MEKKSRLFKRICAAVLVLALTIGSISWNYLAESVRAVGETAALKIAVMSDTHYYPISYVSDCEDYTTYVNGDPKLLKESGGILDAASSMVIRDQPDVLLISGDLTKDGEVKGHQEFAQKLQVIQDACPKTQIYVINGNHDINNTDAWTFASGKKVSVESATPEKFSEIYSGFGYNAKRQDTDKIQYYVNSKEHPEGKVVGGLSYAAQVNEQFVVLALDSGMYSVDSGNGYDHDEHITGGKLDTDLMKWATGVIKEAQKEGKTVIGLMHHGLIPHFKGEEALFSEYVVTDWEDTATQLADAGLRYIFTGHMHANDVAEYTTVKGNHITDVETGSLVSYGSPVRSVTLEKNRISGKESFDISSKTVPSASYTENGQNVTIDNLVDYQMKNLYPKTFLNKMLNGIVTPVLSQMAQSGDLKATLEGLLSGTDVNQTILDVAHQAAAAGMNLNLGDIGTAVITYQNGAIQVKVSGISGALVGEESITDDEILAIVDDVLNQVQTKYINQPQYIKQILDELATELSEFDLGVAKEDGSSATLYDLLVFVLTNHYSGHETAPQWVQEAVKELSKGDIIQELLDTLVPSLCNKITPILQNLHVNFDLAFSGSLIKSTLNSQYQNGQLLALMNGFGFDLENTVNGLIQEYMSQSFRSGMGQIISDIVEGMVYDDAEDDVLNGAHRVVTYDGMMNANPQAPSIANGLLPSEVSMTFGKNPQTDKAFLWYTKPTVNQTVIRYSTSQDMTNAVEAVGTCETVTRPKVLMNLGLMATYTTQQMNRHKVNIENLSAGTTYYYQVGTQGMWSDTASFTTASSDTDKFTAIGVTDSQGMVASDYQVFEKTFQKAQATMKDSEFTMNLGDMVDEGVNVNYWDSLTNNVSWRGQTMVPVSGNHEAKKAVEGVTGDTLSNQFNLEAILNGAADEQGVSYSFEYKNAAFVVLNTNDGAEGISEAQYQWAKNVLDGTDAAWKIILMHKSVYSNGPHYNDPDVTALRRKINRLCEETDVDLVLSGHDHVYNRTPILKSGAMGTFAEEKTVKYGGLKYTQNVNPEGTVFAVIGTAGVKNYEQNTGSGIPSKVSLQPDCPMFSGLTIDANTLYFRAYTYDVNTDKATLADSFSLAKINQEEDAYEAVIQMIDVLPTDITLSDKDSVAQARAAYNVLSEEDKQKVSNYQKLQDAEKIIAALESIENGVEVTVSNYDQLDAALNNQSVTSIIINGTIDCSGGVFSGRYYGKEYLISRNLKIGGNGTIKYGWFVVRNGAQLVLADSIYIDGTRAYGSPGTAITPVSVQDNSSVVLNDMAHVRTEYGTGSNNGNGIHLTGANSSAVINSQAQQWAASGAVYGENATSKITINAGSFESKNWNSSIVGNGTVIVNGGDKIAGLSIPRGAVGYINGGKFTEGTSSTQYTPLVIEGTVYMTAGSMTVSAATGKSVELSGNLYMRPKAANAIQIGGYTPYIGAVSTENFADISAEMGANGGINADGYYDRFCAVDQYTSDLKGQTELSEMTIDTSVDKNTLCAQAPQGRSYVYVKSHYYGDGRNINTVTGNGNAYLYNEMRTIENYAVTDLEIEDGAKYVMLEQDVESTLNVTVKPDNAFHDEVHWSSADETQTQVIDSANGIVKSIKPGVTVITAEAVAYPGVKDSITAITLHAGELQGPAMVVNGSENRYELSLGEGLEDSGLHVKYTVDRPELAEIAEDTGILSAKEAGQVTVTATAYYQDTELPFNRTMTVNVKNLTVNVNCEPEEGGTAETDKSFYILNDKAVLKANAKEGYRFDHWENAEHQIVGTDMSYTTPQLTTDASYTAVFAKLYEVSAADGLQNGKIETNVSEAAQGDTVAVTVTPDAGYQLVKETLKGSYINENGEEAFVEIAEDLTFIMPAANVSVTAEFKKIPYHIVIDSNLANGTLHVTGQSGADGSAVIGDEITITVTPEVGYLLKEGTLTRNGAVITADDNGIYQFTMGAEDVFLTAEFVENQAYTDLKKKIEQAENTDVTGMTEESANALQQAVQEAKKQLVTEITRETADEEIQKLDDAINGLVKVNFLFGKTGEGTILYQNKEWESYHGHVEPGEEVTLQAVPMENEVFLYWQDLSTDEIVSRDQTYTFVMGENKNLMAVFGKKSDDKFRVTVNGELITKAYYNTKVTITAPEAETGQKFIGWKVNGNDKIISVNPTYTFYLPNDMDFEACYAPEGIVEQNVSALLSNVIATKRADGRTDIKFVAMLVIPEGYRLVDAGLIWSAKDDTVLDLNSGLKPTYITTISNTNQYSVTIKGVPENLSIRGKAFAVLEKDGERITVYSEEVKQDAMK